MGNLDRYKREYEWVFEEINQMEDRQREALLKMERSERDKLLVRLLSEKPLKSLFLKMTLESQRRLIDDCFRAWKENQADPN